ncbi:hypothetical protein LEP3755_21880 [Leptolyngbya sp. NIES-3755]|nr:hypothetical protein LEP3755_21880 [Leptolyngbya sp. NIES-3755]
MNRKTCLIAAGLIGLCFSAPIAIQAAPKPLSSTIASASSPSSRTAELTRNISAVEVEKAILLGELTPDTLALDELNKRYTNLMLQLRQLEPARYQALAASATETALARKIAELDVERAIALSRFTIDAPVVQTIARQSLMLEARLKQIQPTRYQALARSAMQSALQAKIAELQALYQQEDRRLIPSAPSQQTLKTQIFELNRRLAEVPKN